MAEFMLEHFDPVGKRQLRKTGGARLGRKGKESAKEVRASINQHELRPYAGIHHGSVFKKTGATGN